MGTVLESVDVVDDIGAANASMALDVQMIAESKDDFLDLSMETKEHMSDEHVVWWRKTWF